MEFKPDQLLERIRREVPSPMRPKDLAKALKIQKHHYLSFKKALKVLLGRGEMVRLKRGRVGLVQAMDVVIGELSVNRAGMGFVPTGDDDPDIMIPATSQHTAMDGDRVMVRLTGSYGDRQLGMVIKVVERAERNVVGIFREGPHFDSVVPDSRGLQRDFLIPSDATAGAKEGQKVVVRLLE